MECAKRALYAERFQAPSILIEKARDPNDGIGFEKRNRHGWIVKVCLSSLDQIRHRFRHCSGINLQTEFERLFRGKAGTNAAQKGIRRSVELGGVWSAPFKNGNRSGNRREWKGTGRSADRSRRDDLRRLSTIRPTYLPNKEIQFELIAGYTLTPPT